MLKILKNWKKFGLHYCDLETMIWNVDVMLRFFAINIDARNKDPPSIFRLTTAIIIANYYYTFIVSVAWFVITGKAQDFAATAAVISLAFTSHISMVKLWFMFINHGAIQKVVSKYLACNAKVDPNSRFARNLNAALRTVKKRAIIFWLYINVNTIVYVVIPLFKTGRHMPDEYLIYYGLEPMLESPNYEIAFTLNVLAMFVIAYAPAHISGLFIIICGYTEAYLLALSKELEALWKDALEFQRTRKDNASKKFTDNVSPNQGIEKFTDNVSPNQGIEKFIADRLEFIAKGHVINVDLIYRVEEVFQLSLAIGLVFLMCGQIADLLGGIENTFMQMPYSLLIVGMDCLVGQRVQEASVVYEKAVYACNWENFIPRNMKVVYLVLMNSQKTIILSAGTVTKLNFETFGKIVKTIYSAYAALQSAVHRN